MAEHPTKWKRVKTAILKSGWFDGISGDSLIRPPKGFDKDHPFIEDLKKKSFFAMRQCEVNMATSSAFLDVVNETFKAALPLMRFMCEAIEIPF